MMDLMMNPAPNSTKRLTSNAASYFVPGSVRRLAKNLALGSMARSSKNSEADSRAALSICFAS